VRFATAFLNVTAESLTNGAEEYDGENECFLSVFLWYRITLAMTFCAVNSQLE